MSLTKITLVHFEKSIANTALHSINFLVNLSRTVPDTAILKMSSPRCSSVSVVSASIKSSRPPDVRLHHMSLPALYSSHPAHYIARTQRTTLCTLFIHSTLLHFGLYLFSQSTLQPVDLVG